MVVLAAGLAVYFGVYLWQGLTDPFSTTYAYEYTVNDSMEADGFLVREEQVLPGRAGIVEVAPGEGEKVAAGETVAVVYRDSQALERNDQIRELELEIELLQYAMTQTGETVSAAELEGDVIQALVELRGDTAAGDFTQLEDQILQLKQAVLKRDYTYGEGVDREQLNQLTSQLRALRSQSAQDTSRVFAQSSGTFSALVDGYEELLTPGGVLAMTPSQLHSLEDRDVERDGQAMGKLILSSRWYFAAALPAEQAQRLGEGDTVTVRFSGDFSQDVEMTVESVSEEEGGEQAVVLSTTRFLSSTTLLRRQTVEIIFQQYQGLRVPKSAVHILTDTRQDEETGQSVQTTRAGVYAVVSGRAEFKEVETVAEGSEFYVVRPLGEGRAALRAGDEVIARGRDLYDGMIVE